MEPLSPQAREALEAFRKEHTLPSEVHERVLARVADQLSAPVSEGDPMPDVSVQSAARAARPAARKMLLMLAGLTVLGGAIVARNVSEQRTAEVVRSRGASTPSTTPSDRAITDPGSREPLSEPPELPLTRGAQPTTHVAPRRRSRAAQPSPSTSVEISAGRAAAPASVHDRATMTELLEPRAAPAHEGDRAQEPPREPATTARAVRSDSDRRISAGVPSSGPSRGVDSLDREVAQLRRARQLLRGGEPLRALSELAEHARVFPDGKLAELRQVARIEALCELGRTEDAALEAARFEQSHPRSPYRERARRVCSAD